MSVRDQESLLRGWEAIGAHLGVRSRTAQLWHERHALPVRSEAGSVVASSEQLDLWVRGWMRYGSLPEIEEDALPQSGEEARPQSGDDARPAVGDGARPSQDRASCGARRTPLPRPRRAWRRTAAVALLVGALLVGALLAVRSWPALGPRPEPTRWRLVRNTLVVEDGAGRAIFARDLGYVPSSVVQAPSYPSERQVVQLVDLEGDGHTEVLVLAADAARHRGELLCLERDGRVRFAIQPSGARHYGGVEYTGPWLPSSAHVATLGKGRALYVTWNHMPWFPSRVQRMSPRGEVTAEYWGNGHLVGVRATRLAGREVLLAWGTNNELHAGSLAILDAERLAGRAPASTDHYRCEDCAAGDPLAYLAFPPSCLVRHDGGHATVHDVEVSARGVRLSVFDGLAGSSAAHVSYGFGPSWSLTEIKLSQDFADLHASAERRGLIDHALGPIDMQDLLPVLRWNGTRFVALPVPASATAQALR